MRAGGFELPCAERIERQRGGIQHQKPPASSARLTLPVAVPRTAVAIISAITTADARYTVALAAVFPAIAVQWHAAVGLAVEITTLIAALSVVALALLPGVYPREVLADAALI